MSFARVASPSRNHAARTVFGHEWFWSAVSFFACWRERETQRRQLRMLNDRMLRDIGLTRSDVDHEIRKPFWQG